MKKFILAATGIVLGVTLLGLTIFASKDADAASSNCNVEVIGTENSANKPNSKFTKDGNKVTAKFKVSGNNCSEGVTLAAWKSTETNRPLSAQTLYKYSQDKFKAGTHKLTVEVPNCYFQVDLVKGMKPTDENGGPKYGPERNMGWLVGGTKECVEPMAACESLKVAGVNRTNFTFTAQAIAKHGATIKAYEFTVTSGGKTVATKTVRTDAKTAKFAYQQTNPGTYNVKVTVKTSEGDKNDPDCKGTFTVKPVTPGKIEVCEIATGKLVEIDPKQMSDKYTTDLTKCAPTPETPVTPEALPVTGPGAMVAIFSGVTTLSSAAYYFISRRFA